MALIAHPVVGKTKSKMICEAFIQGAAKGAEGHVFYGVNETNVKEWKEIKSRGEDWFYIDNSYFDSVRGQQFRVTKNRVQIDPVLLESDGKRFNDLGLQLQWPQDNPDGHDVFVYQSESFMDCVSGNPLWLDKYPRTTLTHVRHWDRNKLKLQKTLEQDLRGARKLVTHSSAAAVTALIEGIPIVVSEMSAVHSLSGAWPADRLRTLSVLADNQYTLNEMKDGTAWQMLHKN